MQEIKKIYSNEDTRIRQRLTNIERPVVAATKKFNLKKIIIIIVVVLFFIILLAGLFWIFNQNKNYASKNWQAVFLSDGQIYFGKIIKEDKQNLILENIYYLKDQGSLQQGSNNLNKVGQDVSLIKLGTELHGPQDQMRINQCHILFIEELKDNSKIVNAIKDYTTK